MPDLSTARVVVVVFKIAGCEACADYLPKFQRIAQRYARCLPIYVVDANDPRYQTLANRLNVSAVPATFALRRGTGLIRLEGDSSEAEIAWLLNIAAREASC
jgi:thioredoxin-like negative regulator of GroEL